MRNFFIFLILIFFCFLGSGIFLWLGIYLPKDREAAREELFLVEPGQGFLEIGSNLEEQKLIKDSLYFNVYGIFTNNFRNLQAGAYSLSSAMSVSEIIAKLAAGEVKKIVITIPEGLRLQEIEKRFSKAFAREMNFARFKVADFQDEFDFLKDVPKQRGLQGFLFPDTYQFFYLATEEEIIREMLSNFDKKLTSELVKEITRQGRTIFDIVIMASLLEEEVRGFKNKKIVSGIFWERINIGKPLQSCATIAYILQEENWMFRAWTFEEMRREIGKGKEIDSPYNTYMHRGLPIGPISNPGLESIIAAIYPETSEYLFFLSTPESQTIFSASLREHSLAKQKYLR